MTRCPAQYRRPGGHQPGDRIVECHLVDLHAGDHEEAGTGFAWSDPMPTACDLTDEQIRMSEIRDRLDAPHEMECGRDCWTLAHRDVPWLVGEVERLTEELDEARGEAERQADLVCRAQMTNAQQHDHAAGSAP